MKTLLAFLLILLTGQDLAAQSRATTTPSSADRVTVLVHPGIELFTVVQLLADKYPPPNQSVYAKEAQAYFAPFANHPAVQYARQLKGVYPDLPELGYCLDNFPAVRIHYPAQTDWYSLNGQDSIQTYMRLCKQFFDDSHFWAFYQLHQADYAAWAQPVRDQLASDNLIGKLDSLYRFRTKAAQWTICLDPLNSWGAHAIMPKTLNPRYANWVVYNVGFLNRESTAASVPTFSMGSKSTVTVWHEGSIWGGPVKTDSEKSYLPLPMTEKLNPGGLSATRKKYTPAFKAECVRQVAAGARQTDVARAQGISPALLGRWQREALEKAVPSSAERDEIKQLRAELRRVEMERDILKKVVTIFAQPPQ